MQVHSAFCVCMQTSCIFMNTALICSSTQSTQAQRLLLATSRPSQIVFGLRVQQEGTHFRLLDYWGEEGRQQTGGAGCCPGSKSCTALQHQSPGGKPTPASSAASSCPTTKILFTPGTPATQRQTIRTPRRTSNSFASIHIIPYQGCAS